MHATTYITVAMIHTETVAEQIWLHQCTDTEPWTWFGNTLVCEPRDVEAILDAYDAEKADEAGLREMAP